MAQTIAHPRAYLQQGDIVLASFSGIYYSARISEIYENGAIKIEWMDGDVRETQKEMKDIVFQDRPDRCIHDQYYNVGEHVEAYSISKAKFRNAKILHFSGRTFRIKWIEDAGLNEVCEASKSYQLLRKILNYHPTGSKFQSFETVLALDMQKMIWRQATIIKAVRPEVYQIAWEKGVNENVPSINHMLTEEYMAHSSHLKSFCYERIEKEEMIYATLGKMRTYGLPKQALLNFNRQYIEVGGYDSGITRPPNSTRSDPLSFYLDSIRTSNSVQISDRVHNASMLGQLKRPYSLELQGEKKNLEPYIYSDELDGFEQLWDAFIPGSYVQELRNKKKGAGGWGDEVRIKHRGNCPQKGFMYICVQAESGGQKTLKLAYKRANRLVKLRKWVGNRARGINKNFSSCIGSADTTLRTDSTTLIPGGNQSIVTHEPSKCVNLSQNLPKTKPTV